MTNAIRSITLLDRTFTTSRVPSTDLPTSLTGTTVGDMTPWVIREELTEAIFGKTNKGTLVIRIDELNTFLTSGPILVDEFAKNKYLIECRLTQTDPNGGSDLKGKVFWFEIGTPQQDVDKSSGRILTIPLFEQQIRTDQSITSTKHIFETPYSSMIKRVNEFNNFQAGSVGISTAGINLPDNENLRQNYDPQGLMTIGDAMDDIVARLSNPNVSGGLNTDYYYTLDPSYNESTPSASSTNLITITAEEFGLQDSGIILDPKNIDTIDATTEQTGITDNVEYRNHVIMRCDPRSGSIPMEHTRYASDFLHAAGTGVSFRGRPEWDSTHRYLKGDQVKRTVSVPVTVPATVVTRFFECVQDDPVSGPYNVPDQDTNHWKEDFIVIPEWSEHGRYFDEDVVYYRDGSTIKFYIANQDILNADLRHNNLFDLPITSIKWSSLAPTIPNRSTTNFTAYVSFSPWTTNPFDWQQNMTGLKAGSCPSTGGREYVGFAVDWNIARDTYDRTDFIGGYYKRVSVKFVTRIETNSNNVTTAEKFHGNRFLIQGAGSSLFSGHTNQIAEWDAVNNTFQFSDTPITNDTVNNLDNSKIYRFDGANWVVTWDVQGQQDRPTPFHLVANVYATKGADGTPSSAIEYRYTWSTGWLPGVTDYRHNSRGVWINFWFPYPRIAYTDSLLVPKDIGYQYGGNGSNAENPKFCMLDTFNDSYDRKGKRTGWNNGLDSEDLGRITSVSFKIKVGFFSDVFDVNNPANKLTQKVTGKANIPMVFWAIDTFDRVWFFKFRLKANDSWELVTVPFGELAPTSLHTPRYDEITKWWSGGYTISGLDFTIKEKEYTGVEFDWNFVRGWGIFSEESYDTELKYYVGGTKLIIEQYTQAVQQLAAKAADMAISIGTTLAGAPAPTQNNAVITQATIALDDFRFDKELICNSSDTVVTAPRSVVENRLEEFDYRNGKSYAIQRKARLSFFPQKWHMRVNGDVRMRVGKRFKIRGNTIPSGELELVCSEVKHISDHTGYFMEVLGERRFTVEG